MRGLFLILMLLPISVSAADTGSRSDAVPVAPAVKPIKAPPGQTAEPVPATPAVKPMAPVDAAASKPAADADKTDAPAMPAADTSNPNPASPAPDTAVPKDDATATPRAKADAGVPKPVPEEPLVSAIPEERMPKTKLSVSPKSVSVGEVVTWKLEVVRRKEDRVHLSSTASFGGLELKSKDKTELPAQGEWVTETLAVELVPFEPGDVVIPSQTLTAVDDSGNLSEIKTDQATVTVKSLIANEPEPELKEDQGQGEVVMEKDYLLLWIAGIIAGIGIVALLTLIARKLWSMRRPKPAPPPPPPRPAEEIAFEKLNALKRSTLLEDGDIKEFHVRLSETVREYIGNRYGFDSLELSSEELISALRRVSITKTEYDLVLDFLGDTDLVKFAKMLPTVVESKDLLEQSYGFVDRTTPKIRAEGAGDESMKNNTKSESGSGGAK